MVERVIHQSLRSPLTAQKSQAKFGKSIKSNWRSSSRYFQELQFKGTELDLNDTESAENLKLPILLTTATCLLFTQLSLFKRALKQLQST